MRALLVVGGQLLLCGGELLLELVRVAARAVGFGALALEVALERGSAFLDGFVGRPLAELVLELADPVAGVPECGLGGGGCVADSAELLVQRGGCGVCRIALAAERVCMLHGALALCRLLEEVRALLPLCRQLLLHGGHLLLELVCAPARLVAFGAFAREVGGEGGAEVLLLCEARLERGRALPEGFVGGPLVELVLQASRLVLCRRELCCVIVCPRAQRPELLGARGELRTHPVGLGALLIPVGDDSASTFVGPRPLGGERLGQVRLVFRHELAGLFQLPAQLTELCGLLLGFLLLALQCSLELGRPVAAPPLGAARALLPPATSMGCAAASSSASCAIVASRSATSETNSSICSPSASDGSGASGADWVSGAGSTPFAGSAVGSHNTFEADSSGPVWPASAPFSLAVSPVFRRAS